MSEKDPEYQKAYDAEMAKLNGETAQATTEPAKEEPKTATEAVTEPKQDEVDAKKLAEELEKAKKALADTQRWGHSNAAEIKRIKQELEEEKRAKNRPAILEANEGLEEAIRFVAQPNAPQNPQEVWHQTVSNAIPDIEDLLGDADFLQKAEQKRAELGSAWGNPIVATRELGNLRATHLRDKAVADAVEKARKDFEQKQKKSTAMQVPGGGGSNQSSADVDEAKRIREMPKADFDKMRRKALGYE